ncbi:MAG: hypothetical protein C0597_04700, partial [Marinilabiliales bacterium]
MKLIIKQFYRNIIRNKVFAIINILGFSIGIACAVLILLWVNDELSYDNFHEKGSRIYRVVQHIQFNDKTTWAITQGPLGPGLKEGITGIEDFSRYGVTGWNIKNRDVEFLEVGAYVDTSFINIFSLQILDGRKENFLKSKRSIYISEDLAKRLFGEKDPMGQIVLGRNSIELMVEGIFKKELSRSSLQFDFLLPMELAADLGYSVNRWNNSGFHNFLLLDDGVSQSEIENKISNFLFDKPTLEDSSILALQPLQNMHLEKDLDFDIGGTGDVTSIIIFSSAAFLILILACINFINLTTAQGINRAREVGIKKTLGASKKNLIFQFLGETFLYVFITHIIALFFVESVIDQFNNFTAKNLTIDYSSNIIYLSIIILIVCIGFISGIYPAFYLSSFKPIDTLKGKLSQSIGTGKLRKFLVVFQFTISISLLIITFTIFKQLSYLHNRDLGFDKKGVIIIPISEKVNSSYESVKNELLKNPSIHDVTRASFLPSMGYNFSNSLWSWEGKQEDNEVLFRCGFVDSEFFKTLQIDIVDGREFSMDYISDSANLLINEKAAEIMGLSDPVGSNIYYKGDIKLEIIGVFKDYNFKSLHNAIEPQIILNNPNVFWYIYLKADLENMDKSVSYIENIWHSYEDKNFDYFFLDDHLNNQYDSDKKTGKIFRILA